MSLSLAIQRTREHLNLTQTALAEQAGVDVRSLKRLESGANTALKTVEAVCSVLNLSPTTGQALAASPHPRLSRKDIKNLLNVRDGILPISTKNIEYDAQENTFNPSKIMLNTLLFPVLFSFIYHKNPCDNTSLLEIFILIVSSSFISIVLEMFLLVSEENRRHLKNVFFYNISLQILCCFVQWVSPTFFSILAIPAWLSMFGIAVFSVRRIFQIKHEIRCDLQHTLEDIIQQLSRPNPNLDMLEKTLFEIMLEAKSKVNVQLDYRWEQPFQVLIWLIQDLRLGITDPSTMKPYFQVAGELAQNSTQSDTYAAIVKARQNQTSTSKPLEHRRLKLYKKGKRHLKGLRWELQSHALSS